MALDMFRGKCETETLIFDGRCWRHEARTNARSRELLGCLSQIVSKSSAGDGVPTGMFKLTRGRFRRGGGDFRGR